MSPRSVHLYDEGTARTLDLAAIAAYLQDKAGIRPAIRGSFLLHFAPSIESRQALAGLLANLKVRDVDKPFAPPNALYGEIEFERRRLAADDRGPFGILYDGFLFQALLRELLPKEELGLSHVHVVFTNRSLGTWEESDLRYHLRTLLLGLPAIISTSGLVEAPAKPREFYEAQRAIGFAAREDLTHAMLKEQFKGRFLDHNDSRLTEVAKGYALQALVYQLTGEAFCPNPDCRLFNAHWQEEMLHAQLELPEFCARHDQLLAGTQRRGVVAHGSCRARHSYSHGRSRLASRPTNE